MALLPAIVALVKTFWIPLTLWGFRNGISLYHQLRATYASNASRIRPCPASTQRALNLLFFSALTCLLLSFQSPPNIFRETRSKLQTPPDVLFARLRHIRPHAEVDELLRDRLQSKESKLLYLAYGHDTFAHCVYCSSSDPISYLVYSLPSLLTPHLAHAAVLALTTSGLFTGTGGARWRPHITLAVLAMAAGELYMVATFNISDNVKSTRWNELDFFHDNLRLYRLAAFMTIDMVLAGVKWLSATQRLFVQPPKTSERLMALLQASEGGSMRQGAAGAVLNAVARDRRLRGRWEEYWRVEEELSTSRGVIEAERRAVERVDVRTINNRADQLANDVVDRLVPGVFEQQTNT
ncbi:MAG: hypothetical protein Q9162_007723 [Coniocarpon cinnabarinum]